MKLVIAEKPSVARDIAKVLKASSKGNGFLYNNQYIVTWAIGHLVSLKEPEELDSRYKKWRMEDLPILPESMELKILPDTKSQFEIIHGLMNREDIESLICATDSGREGELIFRYIYTMADCSKPFQRLWISSMTDEAISEGFSKLRPGSDYDALYESAKCRSEADWLVGMNASRAFTLRYDTLLSIGRVQTPTLQMLVKRRKEIDSFVPEEYWTLQADFGDYKGMWGNPQAKFDKKIASIHQAHELAAKILKKSAVVNDVQNEEKRELPPQLYDLTTLQRDASNILGFSADKTLKLAQSLYEKHKLITYPRTDSRYLSHDMGPVVKKAWQSIQPLYTSLVKPLLEKPVPMHPRIFDDAKLTDHHAIIPTGRKIESSSLSADEAKLFDLIARRIMAAFYDPYIFNSCKIITKCEGEYFISSGTSVIQEGFKAIYKDLPGKKKKEDNALPCLKKQDERTAIKTAVKNEKTKPPAEHTDASLLGEMEHAGRSIENEVLREQMKGCSLGTPATRAAIIERLISVGYAKRSGRQIIATEKGCRLIEAVPQEIASPETTGKWEQALEDIAIGKGDSVRFLSGIRNMAGFLTEYASLKAPEVDFPQEERKGRKTASSVKKLSGIFCPICKKGNILENQKSFFCAEWRSGCRFSIWKDSVSKIGGPEINSKIARALIAAPDGDLKGSTGILHLRDGYVSFTPKQTNQK